MEKDAYRKVLAILAVKRGTSEVEVEREIQAALDGVLAHMDEETRAKWSLLLGNKERPEAEEVITSMIEFFDNVKTRGN